MKKIILFLILSLVLLVGCEKKDVYGCMVKDIEVNDIELCFAIQESESEHYDAGKGIGESCNDEIRQDLFNDGYDYYVEEYGNSFRETDYILYIDYAFMFFMLVFIFKECKGLGILKNDKIKLIFCFKL